MRFGAVALSIVAVGALTPALGHADDIAFCFEEWRPFSYVDETGALAGIQIEIDRTALDRAGLTASYEELPYSRCVAAVEAGTYDAMLLTSDEPSLVESAASTVLWQVGVLVNEAYPADSFDGLDDFTGTTVGLVQGYEYPDAVADFDGWTVEEVADASANLRKVSAGRIDLTIDDVPWARWVARTDGLALKALSPLLFGAPQYAMWNAERGDLRARYDAAIQAVLDDGTVDRIYEDAMGASFTAQRDAASAAFLAE